jgi:hypothetical protein
VGALPSPIAEGFFRGLLPGRGGAGPWRGRRGCRTDGQASKKQQLASNFASRGGRSHPRRRGRRSESGPGCRNPHRASRASQLALGSRGSAAAKSAASTRGCRTALLDTPKLYDMLARGKRNGISRGCEPLRTSSDAPRRGLRPLRFDPGERWIRRSRSPANGPQKGRGAGLGLGKQAAGSIARAPRLGAARVGAPHCVPMERELSPPGRGVRHADCSTPR